MRIAQPKGVWFILKRGTRKPKMTDLGSTPVSPPCPGLTSPLAMLDECSLANNRSGAGGGGGRGTGCGKGSGRPAAVCSVKLGDQLCRTYWAQCSDTDATTHQKSPRAPHPLSTGLPYTVIRVNFGLLIGLAL